MDNERIIMERILEKGKDIEEFYEYMRGKGLSGDGVGEIGEDELNKMIDDFDN